jgi:hypothetical protein
MADFDSIMNKVKSVQATDKDQLLLEKSKGTITSTLIGAGAGILVAYNRKWNVLMGAIIGATITGVLSNFIFNKKEKS